MWGHWPQTQLRTITILATPYCPLDWTVCPADLTMMSLRKLWWRLQWWRWLESVVVPVLVVVVVSGVEWPCLSPPVHHSPHWEAVRLPLSDCTRPGLSSSFRLPGPAPPAPLPPPPTAAAQMSSLAAPRTEMENINYIEPARHHSHHSQQHWNYTLIREYFATLGSLLSSNGERIFECFLL